MLKPAGKLGVRFREHGDAICERLGIPYWVPELDVPAAEDPSLIGERQPSHPIAQLMHKVFTGPGHPVDRVLREGDPVGSFTTLFTPGHSAGHVSFWREGDRTLISGDFNAAWERFDFVATPTAPTVAFELGAKTADPLAMYLNDFCTVPMSLAGIPGISIPNGLSDGLPVGFQIIGGAFSENRILDAAHALEQAIGFDGSSARS